MYYLCSIILSSYQCIQMNNLFNSRCSVTALLCCSRKSSLRCQEKVHLPSSLICSCFHTIIGNETQIRLLEWEFYFAKIDPKTKLS
jgi:hypothetical protein